MDDDLIDEELKIMEEQDAETAISSETFKGPISDMGIKKVKTLDVSATIGEAIKTMQENKFGSIILVENKKLAGIFTERDVLNKVIGKIPNYENEPIKGVMTPNPTSLMKHDMIAYVLNNMHVGGYRHVPIVNEEDEPIGIISIKDVVTFIFEQFPNEIINRLSEPYRGKQTREGA